MLHEEQGGLDIELAGSARPGLATTYEGGDAALLERVLPLVDFLEVTPDSVARIEGGEARLDPVTMNELREAQPEAGILVHGVGLSIGSADDWSQRYLGLLDAFVEQITPVWHSEHLAYTQVGGEDLGTMLALPKTDEMLELVVRRIEQLQERYPLPFLIENVVHVLPDYPSHYSEAAFLNELTRRTGCGLILDLYNLECDAANQGFDIEGFLDELDLATVREIHVASGVEHEGFLLDVHSRTLRDSTLELLGRVLEDPSCRPSAVTYELLREAVPVLGHETIAGELERLSQLLSASPAKPAAAQVA